MINLFQELAAKGFVFRVDADNKVSIHGCGSLEETISVPHGVQVVENGTFRSAIYAKTIMLPSSVEVVKGNAVTKRQSSLEKIVLLEGNNTQSVSLPSEFLKKFTIKNMNKAFFLSMTSRDLRYIVMNSLRIIDDISVDECEALVQAVVDNPCIQDSIFDENIPACSFLLGCDSIRLPLVRVNRLLKNSIESGTAEITAMLLDYKHKRFTSQEVGELEEVEYGIKPPTLEQLKDKFVVQSRGSNVAIEGYIDNEPCVIVPSRLSGELLVTSVGYLGRSVMSTVEEFIIDGVGEISRHCFSNCSNLKRVVLNEGVFWIGEDAFSKCVSLSEVSMPSTIQTIYLDSFFDTKLESIVVPCKLIAVDSMNTRSILQKSVAYFQPSVNEYTVIEFNDYRSLFFWKVMPDGSRAEIHFDIKENGEDTIFTSMS